MPLLLSVGLAALVLGSPAPAAPHAHSDTAVWRGTLAGRHDTTRVRILIARDDHGWRGRLRLCRRAHPADYPIDSVQVDPAAARDDSVPVTFVVRHMAGHPRFTGVVSWDDAIVGTLRTTRRTLAVSLARAPAGGEDVAALLSCR